MLSRGPIVLSSLQGCIPHEKPAPFKPNVLKICFVVINTAIFLTSRRQSFWAGTETEQHQHSRGIQDSSEPTLFFHDCTFPKSFTIPVRSIGRRARNRNAWDPFSISK